MGAYGWTEGLGTLGSSGQSILALLVVIGAMTFIFTSERAFVALVTLATIAPIFGIAVVVVLWSGLGLTAAIAAGACMAYVGYRRIFT